MKLINTNTNHNTQILQRPIPTNTIYGIRYNNNNTVTYYYIDRGGYTAIKKGLERVPVYILTGTKRHLKSNTNIPFYRKQLAKNNPIVKFIKTYINRNGIELTAAAEEHYSVYYYGLMDRKPGIGWVTPDNKYNYIRG